MTAQTILPANTLSSGDIVTNSVRFDTNAYMHKTPGGAGSLTTWTFSTWIKRAKLGASQYILNVSQSDANYQTFIYFNSDDTIIFFDINDDNDQGKLITNRKFRDVGAWYHLVFIWNTTDGTAGDRIQLWVNGVRETSFATQTNPDQNDSSTLGGAFKIDVGRSLNGGGENYLNGYMAQTVYQNASPASPVDKFGEYDSDSPTHWVPKNVSGLAAGTNGFFLDFKDSGNLGNDVFGGTDLTEVNFAATDQSTDTCQNNFATFQPLDFQASTQTLAEGNLKVTTDSGGDWDTVASTIGVTTGKWYFEAKLVTLGTNAIVGVIDINDVRLNTTTAYYIGQSTPGKGYQNNAARPDTGASFGNSYTDDDIIGVAIDMDNLKLYFSKNGTFQNSGDPTSGATGTGAQDLTADTIYCFAVSGYASSVWEANFGSPSFAISSGNADANDHGNFEYGVPSGYLALCTKNLAESG